VARGPVNNGHIGCGTVYRNFDFKNAVEVEPVQSAEDRLDTPRVFGIGMHKTATTSLHHAFEILGLRSWHWSSAAEAKKIYRQMNMLGRSPYLEQFDALCDNPIPLLFRQLDQAYPGSKFILTIRDESKWLDAVRRHFDPAYNKWQPGWDTDAWTNRLHEILYKRHNFHPEAFLARYQRHNAEVMEHFADNLLVMDMDRGAGWPELCKFLGCEEPRQPYPLSNGPKQQ
jgi:hypothetical protein